jgi:hypothetical protein
MFAVAWIDSREPVPRIYGQRLSEAGIRLGQNHPLLSIAPADPPLGFDLETDGFSGGYWLLYADGTSADQKLWLAHLTSTLDPDGPPTEVAVAFGGPKADPRVAASPVDGRVEIVWQGVKPSGQSEVYQLTLTSNRVPLGPVLEMGDPSIDAARSHPSIALVDTRSVITWQERRNGDWGIWMRVMQSGVNPVSGAVRVDQDPGQADQFEPAAALDSAGHAFFVWTDLRSISSGSDILSRVMELTPTAVDEIPTPPPEPPPAPPVRMRVGPAMPNPFSGGMGIPIEVPADRSSHVRATILDVQGRLVARLYDGEASGGRIVLRWNGSDGNGREVSSGVYWLVAESGGERHAIRLVRIR